MISGKQTMFTNHKVSAMEADNNSQHTQYKSNVWPATFDTFYLHVPVQENLRTNRLSVPNWPRIMLGLKKTAVLEMAKTSFQACLTAQDRGTLHASGTLAGKDGSECKQSVIIGCATPLPTFTVSP